MNYTVLPYQHSNKPNIVVEFYSQQTRVVKTKIIRQLSYLQEYGICHEVTDLKKMSGYEFWEVRILGKENIRIIVWGHQKDIYVLHIFSKKTQKTNQRDLNLAQKRLVEIRTNISVDS